MSSSSDQLKGTSGKMSSSPKPLTSASDKMSWSPDTLKKAFRGPKIPTITTVSSLFTWLGTKGGYSSIFRRNPASTYWRRHFSAVTTEGRFNIILATYLAAAMGVLILSGRPIKLNEMQKAPSQVSSE